MSRLETQIITVKDLLLKENLTIPEYQRPYKWTVKNVHQLVDDIINHRKHSAYRLGTIVFHRDEKGQLNVVDGQQRTISLLLLALALHEHEGPLSTELKKSKVETLHSPWFEGLTFSNLISLNNIRTNYRELTRRILDFDVDSVLFFYGKCELVEVILDDVSEAFQFFDSQNARGKDLSPHDLLKAFHLREMSEGSSEVERLESVKNWEELDTQRLEEVFGLFLFRIRNWSKGLSARHFTKNEVGVFKGVSPKVDEPFPFADIYRISHFYVKGYNQEYHRNIDRKQMKYPFQLDQVIINGKRFFEMIDHYMDHLDYDDRLDDISELTEKILDTLDSPSYTGRKRTGDKYVRTLFDCAVIYYIDKFGLAEIDRAIEKFFLWAYSLRLTMQNVQLASIDNYALEAPHVFKTIKEALHPKEVLTFHIPVIEKVASRKTGAIEKLFKELNHIYV